MKSVRARITGRVQGVGFRAWTQHQAELHGLQGWVRNRRDGRVEAMFAGPSEAVEAMLKACRQGPRGSRVDGLDLADADAAALEGSASRFSILPTA